MRRLLLVALAALLVSSGLAPTIPVADAQAAPRGFIGKNEKTGFYSVLPYGKFRIVVVRDERALGFLYRWHQNGLNQPEAVAPEQYDASDLLQDQKEEESRTQRQSDPNAQSGGAAAQNGTEEDQVPDTDEPSPQGQDREDDLQQVRAGQAGRPTGLPRINFDKKMLVIAYGAEITKHKVDAENENRLKLEFKISAKPRSFHAITVEKLPKVFYTVGGRERRADELTINRLLREDIELQRKYGKFYRRVSAAEKKALMPRRGKSSCPIDGAELTTIRTHRHMTVRYCENDGVYFAKDTLLKVFYGAFRPGLYPKN